MRWQWFDDDQATRHEMLKTNQAPQYKVLETILPFVLKGNRHSVALVDEGLDEQGTRRLETDAGLHRTSLELMIQMTQYL